MKRRATKRLLQSTENNVTRLMVAMRDMMSRSTANRLKGRVLEHWVTFLEKRGYGQHMYVLDLKDQGLISKGYMQAWKGEFLEQLVGVEILATRV